MSWLQLWKGRLGNRKIQISLLVRVDECSSLTMLSKDCPFSGGQFVGPFSGDHFVGVERRAQDDSCHDPTILSFLQECEYCGLQKAQIASRRAMQIKDTIEKSSSTSSQLVTRSVSLSDTIQGAHSSHLRVSLPMCDGASCSCFPPLWFPGLIAKDYIVYLIQVSMQWNRCYATVHYT
jgi:hypothetical protein